MGEDAGALASDDMSLPTPTTTFEDLQVDATDAAQGVKPASSKALPFVGSATWTAAPNGVTSARRMLAAAAPPVVKPSTGPWSVRLL